MLVSKECLFAFMHTGTGSNECKRGIVVVGRKLALFKPIELHYRSVLHPDVAARKQKRSVFATAFLDGTGLIKCQIDESVEGFSGRMHL